MNSKPYLKFGIMMLTSFVIMYVVMFLNVATTDHVMLSTMRTYMTLLMIAPMAISMMLFMWKMYKNKILNYIILTISSLLLVSVFFMEREQTGISDVQWMKAMIPHHSSAILTSSNADLKDPEVKKLANDIIEAQEREIAEMKSMIKRLEN
ncbi:MAG: DUF305 domain-containing protein [Nonlabens sp.]|uniref:DUF305 domain-containing protein n=1 Tax=Nonlabens sp. TaxID=1888209 RepID=UPI003EF9E752